MVRLMRTRTLRTKELDFVTAARALGAGPLRVVRRLIVYVSGHAGVLISSEAILTFAGVGLHRRPVEE